MLLNSISFSVSNTYFTGWIRTSGDWIGFGKPLTYFISSENIELEIENWFDSSFQTLKRFIEKTSQLDWHI